jgi:two-component system CheB/CheR fusion protein
MKKSISIRKKKSVVDTSIPDKLSKAADFPIVAIGASAGGLEAVSEFFKNISPTTGMAFLYVQHLSPDHKSMLDTLLAKTTSMKVQQATNKMKMLPNNVYVIPPDKEMNIVDGHIKISPRPEIPKVNLPIDILFISLAETHKENVIGIILSGSATDGTRGMKIIKHEGGLTFAQDDTAKFTSMPRSAIASGAVDFILSPK